MKRIVAVLAFVVLPVTAFTSPAQAVGYGACTIVGTMTFSTKTQSSGTWAMRPAILDCQGIIGKRARIIGRGPISGEGSYSLLSSGDGTCLQSGTGKVQYEIPTASGLIKVNESASHTLAGVGLFDTPSLHGSMQLPPPYDEDCVTKPVTRAMFVAQVLLYRYPREFPPPLPGV